MKTAYHNTITFVGRTPDPDHWRDQAVCADPKIDPALFYDLGNHKIARTFCDVCPVVAECLADVMAMPASLRNTAQTRAGRYFPAGRYT